MTKRLAAESACNTIIGRHDASTGPITGHLAKASRAPSSRDAPLCSQPLRPRCHLNIEAEMVVLIGPWSKSSRSIVVLFELPTFPPPHHMSAGCLPWAHSPSGSRNQSARSRRAGFVRVALFLAGCDQGSSCIDPSHAVVVTTSVSRPTCSRSGPFVLGS